MTTQEIKRTLSAELIALRGSSQKNRGEIAIEKNAEEMDEIQQGTSRTLVLDSLTRKWEMASLVSQALERIENKTYGTCLECDEPISPKRIAALPWAKYCIGCQELKDSIIPEMRWDSAA
jgi:DnaK suppressor protein